MVQESLAANYRGRPAFLTRWNAGFHRLCHRSVHTPQRRAWHGAGGVQGGVTAVLLGMTLLLSALSPILLGAAAHAKEPAETDGTAHKARPSRSSTIAITSDDRYLVVVNRETNSVSVIEVRDQKGHDTHKKLAEIPVEPGLEPRYVALHPNDEEAYVTNALSDTVSVIRLAGEHAFQVVAEIPVGTEPRGCALTPNGKRLFVANHTDGTVSIIDTAARTVIDTLDVGTAPTSIAITAADDGTKRDDDDDNEHDERVFVTQFFAEPNPERSQEIEGFDDGKRGIVRVFRVRDLGALKKIALSPLLDVGFTSDRSQFCPQTFVPPMAGQVLHSDIFCPDINAAPGSDVITQDPQGAFPNQLFSAVIRNNLLYLPNICAGPEPVERFNANVQGCVHVIEVAERKERTDLHVNLNVEVAAEPPPQDPTASLAGLFANDLVAIDANQEGTVFLLVSRGGNFVFRARPDDDGKLTLGTPIVRIQTGNLPNGVVISHDGTRAYTNNEANLSVTAIDLEANKVLTLDIPSSEPPAPGTQAHNVLLGKVAFFTALGVPDNNFLDTPVRDIVPLQFRGKMSKDAWSSCGSCHPDGLADGVTWFFGTGPRQTIPLDGMFAKDTNMNDQRLLNWSAVRGSNHDFNNNSRVTQGGCGFASAEFVDPPEDPPAECTGPNPQATPANPAIYDHGITQGGSDALDVQTLWIFFAVRPLNQPQPEQTDALEAGRAVFEANCASCHGGPKWTKSQIFHRDNPAAVSQGGLPLDPGVLNRANEFRSFTCNELTFNYLEDVGTFDGTNPIELRDITAITALGADGFNPPSLLSIRYHAPYLHRGQAQTLEEVFPLHALGDGTIASLPAQAQQDLLVFLNAIDGTTDPLRSEGDDFRDALRLQEPPCPSPPAPAQSRLLRTLGGR
jgi:YVTN family beta-propeller protein